MKVMNLSDRRIMPRDNGTYTLMLKDNKVCEINTGTGIVTMFAENLLPLDLYLEWDASQDAFNNLTVFQWWCANRILSLEREYAKEILNSCGLKQAATARDKAAIAQNYDLDLSFRQFDMMLLCDFLVGNSDRHQDNWGYLFNDRREIIGFAPIFDFNHAFEAPEGFFSLPDMLFDRKRTMLDAAKEVVQKYDLHLVYLAEDDKYAEFINERIKALEE